MISGSGKKFLSPCEGVAALGTLAGTSAPLHTRGPDVERWELRFCEEDTVWGPADQVSMGQDGAGRPYLAG